MTELIQPQEFKVTAADGTEKTYILSKFPAVQGREIIAKYPTSGLPKIGDYAVNEDIMFKLMSYVAVDINGRHQRLETKDLVNNHCTDWETLAKIEMAMMEYNCSFFRNGRSWDLFENFVQIMLQKITETLTPLSQLSSQMEKQHSTNSEQSIQ